MIKKDGKIKGDHTVSVDIDDAVERLVYWLEDAENSGCFENGDRLEIEYFETFSVNWWECLEK